MKSTTNKTLDCDKPWGSKQIITDAEMQEIDESLRPIESKAVAKARDAVILNRIRIAATTFAVMLIIYTLFHFL